MPAEVLIVGESTAQALRLKLILEKEGLKVSLADTGRAGMAMALLLLPAAVVLDANLPDIDGFHVCQALKDHPATLDIPLLMLTDTPRDRDTLTDLDSGTDVYVPKDAFTESNLLQALRDLRVL